MEQVGNSSRISKCFNSGNITATGDDTSSKYIIGAGGILGHGLDAPNYDVIEFCYNTGKVSLTCNKGEYATAAGISANSTSRINSCYNTGSVSIESKEGKEVDISGRKIGTVNVVGGIKAFSSDDRSCYKLL